MIDEIGRRGREGGTAVLGGKIMMIVMMIMMVMRDCYVGMMMILNQSLFVGGGVGNIFKLF